MKFGNVLCRSALACQVICSRDKCCHIRQAEDSGPTVLSLAKHAGRDENKEQHSLLHTAH